MSKAVKQEKKTVVPLTASFEPKHGAHMPIRVQVREVGQFFRLTAEDAISLATSLAGAMEALAKAERDKAWERSTA